MPQATPPHRGEYAHFLRIQTRWMDNDVYGHVNNVVYYAYFDTVINRYLIEVGELDIHRADSIGLCVESTCHYLAAAAYPEELDAGLRVEKLGTSSVRYGIGIFRRNGEELCAYGHFVHVFVDRSTRRPVPIAGVLREALEKVATSPKHARAPTGEL